MTREKYLRGWLLLPLCFGAFAVCERVILGPEMPPDPAGTILVYLLAGFILGGIPYAISVAFLWDKIPRWNPWVARIVSISLPWMWISLAIPVFGSIHGAEHQTANPAFPWEIAVAFLIWFVAALLLEPILVRPNRENTE